MLSKNKEGIGLKAKRIVVWFLAVVMVVGGFGITPVVASDVQDVPTDHWAYQAVQKIVSRGYMGAYEDGTFQGTRTVDRYTLAMVLARLLDEIDRGQIPSSVDDFELIQELTNELRSELVQWYTEREEVEEKLGETQRIATVTEERMHRVTASQVELQEEVQRLRAEIMAEAERNRQALAEQQTTLDIQSGLITRNHEQIERFEEGIDIVQQAIFQLEDELLLQRDSLDHLENWVGEKGAVFAVMETENVRLWETTEQLTTDMARSQEDIDYLHEQLEGLVRTVANADGGLLRTVEQNRIRVDELAELSSKLERDLQNLAVRIQRETEGRASLEWELDELTAEVQSLELQVGVSEEELARLSRQISDEIQVQMNTAIIREQRLERQLVELQEDFGAFKLNAEQQHRSLRSQATIGMIIGAIGILVGFIGN